MKKVLWIIVAVLFIVVLIIGFGTWFIKKEFKEDDPEFVLQLIKEQADSKNVALSIVHNGKQLADVNSDQPLPLASTMKIIVAIEYAQQAAEGTIDPEKKVSLQELEKYYISKTDGGAHQAWIDSLNSLEQVPISEVANGMIAFSSNANTDFLINLLGVEHINDVLIQTELSAHEPIYSIGGGMFIPLTIMEEGNLSKKEALKVLEDMSLDDYRARANEIFKNWNEKPPTSEEKKESASALDMKFQKIWSDRLPRATTSDYVSLMEKLNSKQYFSKETHTFLDPVMEGLMQNPQNREWLKHAGQKGGSTAFVLTKAMYAEDKKGNRTEFAFFANDLGTIEQMQLTKKLNSFQLEILTNPSFRSKVEKILGTSNSVNQTE